MGEASDTVLEDKLLGEVLGDQHLGGSGGTILGDQQLGGAVCTVGRRCWTYSFSYNFSYNFDGVRCDFWK